MQVAGFECQICKGRISLGLDGIACRYCNSRFHTACLENAEKCPSCERLFLNTETNGPIRSRPAGFGGWLILPAVGLAVSPFLCLFQIVHILASWFDTGGIGLTGTPFDVLMAMIFFFWGIRVAILFFRKDSYAPQAIVVLLFWRLVLLTLGLLFSTLLTVDTVDRSTVVVLLWRWRAIIPAGLACAVWIPYFKRSVRVRNTFRVGGGPLF